MSKIVRVINKFESGPGRKQLATRQAEKNGGAREDRTPDLVNAIHALSQLSYGPEGARY